MANSSFLTSSLREAGDNENWLLYMVIEWYKEDTKVYNIGVWNLLYTGNSLPPGDWMGGIWSSSGIKHAIKGNPDRLPGFHSKTARFLKFVSHADSQQKIMVLHIANIHAKETLRILLIISFPLVFMFILWQHTPVTISPNDTKICKVIPYHMV